MTRLITIAILLTLTLAACDTVVIPPHFAPHRDRRMDCRTVEYDGARFSECTTGERGARGRL